MQVNLNNWYPYYQREHARTCLATLAKHWVYVQEDAEIDMQEWDKLCKSKLRYLRDKADTEEWGWFVIHQHNSWKKHRKHQYKYK